MTTLKLEAALANVLQGSTKHTCGSQALTSKPICRAFSQQFSFAVRRVHEARHLAGTLRQNACLKHVFGLRTGERHQNLEAVGNRLLGTQRVWSTAVARIILESLEFTCW